jgi:hypothetical protein
MAIMKRADVIEAIRWIILDDEDTTTTDSALRILSYLEDIGMQPPVCSPSLVEDKYHGGTKHGPAERRWDDEEV